MVETAEKQQFTFQAEVKQLLALLSHSLYQHREIALRELISNASDSLSKLRHVQLTDAGRRDEAPLEIELIPDAATSTLTVRDNGVGLTHDEMVSNLGTIARSGSLEFLKQLGDARGDISLIGQFGVGFYSAFMLADRVEVISRSYRDTAAWKWESDGSGSFSVEPAPEETPRGAQIRLHLKSDARELLDATHLKEVVSRYSTFVPFPIRLSGSRVNEQRPIWVEPKSQLTDEQYTEFYRFLTHGNATPLWKLHVSLDSPLQVHAIVYCGETNPELLGGSPMDQGLHLCAKRVLVQDDCRDILPEYLRFVVGLVDSADLPLNVSRETLQDGTVLRKIGTVLVKKILDSLSDLADEQPETFRKFIDQFGPILRSGVATDFLNREKIARLLRFRSTFGEPTDVTSLADYVKRVKPGQKQIYFAAASAPGIRTQSPSLEAFERRGLEVLFLNDPLDEIVFSHLGQFETMRLVSIDGSDVELPPDESADAAAAPPVGFSRVLELFKTALQGRASDVKESRRLTESPACLVNPLGAMSLQLQRAMQAANRGFTPTTPVLEVNPHSALIERLSVLSGNPDHDAFIQQCGEQLYADALLREGLPGDAESHSKRVLGFMLELANSRSSIVT
jgi:molecular chaperone HtpG